MRGAGWFLVAIGGLCVALALIMETAVGGTLNFGLLVSKLLAGTLGGSFLIAGCVLIGAEGICDGFARFTTAPGKAPAPTGKHDQVNLAAFSDLNGRRL